MARPNGIIHSWAQEPNHPEIAPAARAREVDLMFPNLGYLGLRRIEKRCKATMAPIDGASVAVSFQPTGRTWNADDYTAPSYYPMYDWIRGESLHLFDPSMRWHSPGEQTLSMMPPEILFDLIPDSMIGSER